MKIVVTSAFCFQLTFLFAQGIYTSGAKNIALSGATVSQSDEWFYFNNPGAISQKMKMSFGFSYENRFLLKEMQSQSLVGIIPLKKGVLTVGSQMYGYAQFRSFKTGAGFALPLAEFISAGIQLNYQGIRLNQNYGSKNAMTAEIGVLTKLNKKVSVGFSVFNIGSTLIDEYEFDRFTNLMRLGVGYNLSERVKFLAEVEKDSEFPMDLKFATEYLPSKNVFLRGGFALQPVCFSFGFGYVFVKSFFLDFWYKLSPIPWLVTNVIMFLQITIDA